MSNYGGSDPFVGDYKQIPPAMYSAIKHNGKKLYELAREGIEIEREPRTVHIDAIKINEIHISDEEKTVRITVSCSKGTYIRTLCHDIGNKLGCGACMMKLVRTRVGQFMVDDSLTFNQISALMIKGNLKTIFILYGNYLIILNWWLQKIWKSCCIMVIAFN